MAMHKVIKYRSTLYVVTLHGVNCNIAVLQQCKCTSKLYCIDLIIILRNVIKVSILHAAFNFSWINNLSTGSRFVVAY
jgi:hypothetical protein